MPDARPMFVISDLHMGDGSARDNFAVKGRDEHLSSFLDHVDRENGELVILGDLFEFWQANVSKVIMMHKDLLDRLAKLNARYVVGNHDADLDQFNGSHVLSLPFFERMSGQFERVIGEKKFRFMHGHEVDPFCCGDTPGLGRVFAIFAGMVEDWNKSPLLSGGQTVENVLTEAGETLLLLWDLLKATISNDKIRAVAAATRQELTPAQNSKRANDMLAHYEADKEARKYDVAIVGHTHQPGQFGNWYFNSGSWVEKINSFIRISESGDVGVFNWVGGRPEENSTILSTREATRLTVAGTCRAGQMSKAELEVEVANARLDAAQARAIRAESEWSRAKSLLPQDAISGTDLDQAECNHKVAQADLREVLAQVELAKLALGQQSDG